MTNEVLGQLSNILYCYSQQGTGRNKLVAIAAALLLPVIASVKAWGKKMKKKPWREIF